MQREKQEGRRALSIDLGTSPLQADNANRPDAVLKCFLRLLSLASPLAPYSGLQTTVCPRFPTLSHTLSRPLTPFHTLTCPSSPTKMLGERRSPCTYERECRYAIPAATLCSICSRLAQLNCLMTL